MPGEAKQDGSLQEDGFSSLLFGFNYQRNSGAMTVNSDKAGSEFLILSKAVLEVYLKFYLSRE